MSPSIGFWTSNQSLVNIFLGFEVDERNREWVHEANGFGDGYDDEPNAMYRITEGGVID